jgi:ribosome maturation factor RimP
MNWQSVVERTVAGLGFDLVGVEKTAGGLLRVYVDHLPLEVPDSAERFIHVDDCEKIIRQLQHVLEVEGCSYERLEVSSPGLDRPLNKPADYARFVGEKIEIVLKVAFKGRKKYQGELEKLTDGWRLVLADHASAAAKKPGKKAVVKPKAASAGAEEPIDVVLDFSLDEVREARLVPVLDFKGKRFMEQNAMQTDWGAVSGAGDEVDGGRIQ